MKRGQTYEVKIEKVVHRGQGIGYIDGKVCFVNGVIPAEVVRIKIVEEKKDYLIGSLLEIIQASSYRIKPECPLFLRCGGCHLQHIEYNYQKELKKSIFIDTCRRVGSFEPGVDNFFALDQWFYRNKAQLPVQDRNGLKIGYYQTYSHLVVDHDFCPINERPINIGLSIIKRYIRQSKVEIYDEERHRGNLRHLIIRSGVNTGQLHLTFVTRDRVLPEKLYGGLERELNGLVGIVQNVNPDRTNRILGKTNLVHRGREYLEEKIGNKILRIGPATFFQVNTKIVEMMGEKVLELLSPQGQEILLDLYSGIGTFGISIAERVVKVIAIEENSQAVHYGMENTRVNNIKNIEFIQGRVEKQISGIKKADLVIIDPPRKGIDPSVIENLARLKTEKILYISCNPATFARDGNRFSKKGFRISRCYIFDMFPQTYHMEIVGLLVR